MLPLTAGSLGLLLGMRHALEPDHLAAVSTMLGHASGARRSALLGAFWGLGHTLSLVAVGTALALLQAAMPQALGNGLELVVAVMLVVLGALNVWRAFQPQQGPNTPHAHGALLHEHQVGTAHVHVRAHTVGLRPLLVGLVHGAAGSGALTAMAVVHAPTTAARILYMLLFGLGSTLGMALLAGVLGLPLQNLLARPRFRPLLSGVTGVLSMGMGLAWGAPLLGW